MKEPPRHDMDDYGQHDPNIGSAQLPRLFRPIYQRTVIAHLPPGEAELSGWTPRPPPILANPPVEILPSLATSHRAFAEQEM